MSGGSYGQGYGGAQSSQAFGGTMQPKGQFGIRPPAGGLTGQPTSRLPMTGGAEPNMGFPRTGGVDPMPTGMQPPAGVQPQPVVPGASGAKAGFTQPMMNLAGMGQGQVAQLLGGAKDDGQRMAMLNAFRAAQNPHAGTYLEGLWGGADGVRAKSLHFNEGNRQELPVWDAATNTFRSQQDDYYRQMGWTR